ncbi:hypothetical protein AVEN_260494-1 [Araneus ventricosus]|uniref:Uncharacterized protein n=1 Tax=Araneus ventricosus TaxID=182803 RepID=A0A4Y2QMD1_ARAVE|nr:hypothetical protein AVEN_260494-1 [Araneus ventricosus]
MKIGIDRQRCLNSNEVGFRLEWMAIKMKCDFSRRREITCVGGGKCFGVAARLEKSGRGVEGALSKTWKSLLGGEGEWAGGEVGGIKAAVMHFGFSVNEIHKSIDLMENKQVLGPNGMVLTTCKCPT